MKLSDIPQDTQVLHERARVSFRASSRPVPRLLHVPVTPAGAEKLRFTQPDMGTVSHTERQKLSRLVLSHALLSAFYLQK